MQLDAPKPAVRRPEIDGLRGLAALLVIIFHIWFSGLSGGVDMLFVVSGYFLIRGILRKPEAPRLEPMPIWSGFARRLFPQLVVFLIAVTGAIFIFADPAHRAAELRHVAYSAVFAENYYLAWSGPKPPAATMHQAMVEHLWALSVVGQIYILAPLGLAVFEALRRRWGPPAERAYPALLGAIALASFSYAQWAVNANPDVAYYELPARIWQFAAGGLIAALRLPERPAPRALANAASWLGLTLALSAGASVGQTAGFPAAAALWPACAAALILIFARSTDGLNAGRLLGRKLFCTLGRDSYGIYMWHWPLAVLALNANGWTSLSWAAGLALILASWGLAVAGRKCGEAMMSLLPASTPASMQNLLPASALVAIAAVAVSW